MSHLFRFFLGLLVVASATSGCSFWVSTGEVEGSACEAASELQRRAQKSPGRERAPRVRVDRLIPRPPEGYVLMESERLDLAGMVEVKRGRPGWAETLNELGYSDGLWAQWRTAAGEFIIVESYTVATPDAALILQSWANGLSCPFAREVFAVADVPGSIGFRIPWSGGFTNHQVSFVRGNTRFLLISGNGTDTPPPRAHLEQAARSLDAALGAP